MFTSYPARLIAAVYFVLGVGAAVLGVLSFLNASANRDLQRTASANQARIDRGVAFANLDNNLIQLTAKSASDNKDAALTALLSSNGVTFHKNPMSADGGAQP